MEQKRGKCWKLAIVEGKLQVFISYLSEIKTWIFGGHNKATNKTALMTFSVQMNLMYCFNFCRYTVSSTMFPV